MQTACCCIVINTLPPYDCLRTLIGARVDEDEGARDVVKGVKFREIFNELPQEIQELWNEAAPQRIDTRLCASHKHTVQRTSIR